MPHRNKRARTPAFEPEAGQIVRSRTGRDRFRVFLVVEVDRSDRIAPAVIADGELRRLEDRKHKNPAHLDLLGKVGKNSKETDVTVLTNVEIAEICRNFEI